MQPLFGLRISYHDSVRKKPRLMKKLQAIVEADRPRWEGLSDNLEIQVQHKIGETMFHVNMIDQEGSLLKNLDYFSEFTLKSAWNRALRVAYAEEPIIRKLQESVTRYN